MSYLQEQLNYIYLQEDLATSAQEIMDDSEVDGSKKPSPAEVKTLLKKVPDLNTSVIKRQAEKSPYFKKHYQEALDKLGAEANNPIGESIALLYATSKSVIESTNNSSTKSRLTKHIDKLFDTLLNHPGRLVSKGVKVWLVSFLMLFVFWWIPSAREILKSARQLALIMIMIGLVFAILKLFMKSIAGN